MKARLSEWQMTLDSVGYGLDVAVLFENFDDKLVVHFLLKKLS